MTTVFLKCFIYVKIDLFRVACDISVYVSIGSRNELLPFDTYPFLELMMDFDKKKNDKEHHFIFFFLQNSHLSLQKIELKILSACYRHIPCMSSFIYSIFLAIWLDNIFLLQNSGFLHHSVS